MAVVRTGRPAVSGDPSSRLQLRLPRPTTTSVTLEFGEGGGVRDLELRLAAPPGAVAEPSGVRLRVVPLAHEHTIARPGASGTSLAVDLPADADVARLRLLELKLPGGGGAFHRFSLGGVTVETPTSEGGKPPPGARKDVVAVLSAGPAGGKVGPPAVGFPGFGPPGPLFGDQLPGGTASGQAQALVLQPPAPLRAGRLRLTFCTHDGDPVSLAPVAFSVDAAEVVRLAWPEQVAVEVGGILAWEHSPPLTATAGTSLDPVLGAALREPMGARAPGAPARVPVTVRCKGPAKLRVELTSPDLRLVRGRLERPAKLAIAGAPAMVELESPGPVAATVRARLTGSFGAVRRTAGSHGDGAGDRGATTGYVASPTQHVAIFVAPAALEGRPLVRAALLGASAGGEVVVELRAESGGPGEPLVAPGIAAIETAGRARWIAVAVGPLAPAQVPAAGLWLVVRTNRGRFLWTDGAAGGGVSLSGDGGVSWSPVAPGGTVPAWRLFVDDPGGAAPIVAAVGDARAALLPAPPSQSFDGVVAWPAALRNRIAGDGPIAVALDAVRDVDLEIRDVELVDAAPLTLHGAPG